MLEVLLQLRHRRFRRDLSAYLDGVLPQRARRRLEAHLDSCQACRQELTELRSTVEALGSLPMAEVPRSFALAAAPIAEVRPRPAARRLEFGLRLATATAAFALTLVLIGDFAGLPGGGEKEEMRGGLLSAAQETPAAMEAAPATSDIKNIQPAEPLPGQYEPSGEVAPTETPPVEQAVPFETPPVETPAAEGMAAADETPPALVAAPAETPVAEQTRPPIAAAPVETPAAVGAAPAEIPGAEETPAADQTPPAPAAVPVETPAADETPEPSGITETYGEEPTVGAGASEEEDAEKAATEGAGGEEQTEAYASRDQAAAEEDEGGGLSREEAVRWLEIGLGASVGVLAAVWALARLQRSIGSRP
jgi:hypothetical protein